MDIKGKVAVITGGASGLGLALAIALSNMDAKIAVLDFNSDSLAALPPGFMGIKCDVADLGSVQSAFAQVKHDWGVPDIVALFAGFPRDNFFAKMPVEDWLTVINVTLNGAFFCTKTWIDQIEAERKIRQAEVGVGQPVEMPERVILYVTSSSETREGKGVGQANYVAAKAGVMGLAKIIGLEQTPRNRIRVLRVGPGWFKTPLTVPYGEEKALAYVQDTALQMIGDPWRHLAPLLIAYIENEIVTDVLIQIDGGARA